MHGCTTIPGLSVPGICGITIIPGAALGITTTGTTTAGPGIPGTTTGYSGTAAGTTASIAPGLSGTIPIATPGTTTLGTALTDMHPSIMVVIIMAGPAVICMVTPSRCPTLEVPVRWADRVALQAAA